MNITHHRIKDSQRLSDRWKGFAYTGQEGKTEQLVWMDFYFL